MAEEETVKTVLVRVERNTSDIADIQRDIKKLIAQLTKIDEGLTSLLKMSQTGVEDAFDEIEKIRTQMENLKTVQVLSVHLQKLVEKLESKHDELKEIVSRLTNKLNTNAVQDEEWNKNIRGDITDVKKKLEKHSEAIAEHDKVVSNGRGVLKFLSILLVLISIILGVLRISDMTQRTSVTNALLEISKKLDAQAEHYEELLDVKK